VCGNDGVDIEICTAAGVTGTHGDENTCGTTKNYDDNGTCGCTYSCEDQQPTSGPPEGNESEGNDPKENGLVFSLIIIAIIATIGILFSYKEIYKGK
jgi:hypothetical protein